MLVIWENSVGFSRKEMKLRNWYCHFLVW